MMQSIIKVKIIIPNFVKLIYSTRVKTSQAAIPALPYKHVEENTQLQQI